MVFSSPAYKSRSAALALEIGGPLHRELVLQSFDGELTSQS